MAQERSFVDYLVEKDSAPKSMIENILIVTEKNFELSDDGKHFTVNRIEEECKKMKLDCNVCFIDGYFIRKIEPTKISLTVYDIEGEDTDVEVEVGKTAVIVRGSFLQNDYGASILEVIKSIGVKLYNPTDITKNCSNKYLTYLKLKDHGILMPKTEIITNVEAIDMAVKNIGGKFPIIVKTLSGAEGIGITKADSIESLKSILQLVWKLEGRMLIQEYIESKGDVRTIFINGKYIASMTRTNPPNDFRSNKALGGTVKKYELSDEELAFVTKIDRVLGGYFLGIDYIIDGKKLYLIEVNSSPGTEGIEQATKMNIVEILLQNITGTYKE